MMERPVDPAPDGLLHLKVFVDGTVVVAYINESIALSHRAYDHRGGQLGLFVTEGSARFSHVQVMGLKSAR